MLPFHLRNRWFGRGGDSDSTDSGSAAPSSRIPSSDPDDLTYYPSLWDVLKVRYLLQWKASKEGLPTELVDAIIDAAEYWPSTVRHMEGGRRIISTDRDQVLLKTVPLCYDPSVRIIYYFESFEEVEFLLILERIEPWKIHASSTTSSPRLSSLS